uniref:Uncharacterized protein n=1 Tax=viral metagenome TaxID=1070528 RepID=A0A6C0KSL7_9ZZZZ
MSFSNSSLYFSPSHPSTIIDRIVGTNGTIFETINGNLYTTSSLSTIIGRVAISQTIFDINDVNMNGLFETTGQTAFVLPMGTVMYTFSGQTIRLPSGNYVFPNAQYTYNITSGVGNYQPLYGTVTVTSTDSPDGSTQLRVFNMTLNWRRSHA